MPPYFLSFRTALAVRACPAFAEALSRAKGKSKGICFPEFSAACSSRAAKARLAYSPERAPRSRGPSDSNFRAMSHLPHFSSAGAEYFSPARERWLEISHDRVLQGRHNHVLCLRFRVFFAKAGRQSSPQCRDGSPTRPGRADRPTNARLLLGRAPASAVPLKCFLFTPRASARSRGPCHPRRPAKAWVARRITPAKKQFL